MTSPSPTEYRTIDRFPGYQIGSDGSIIGKFGRLLSTPVNSKGYARVGVCVKGSKMLNRGVHQLVCEAFHGQKHNPLHVVRHLDGNSLNNNYSNLCWGTPKQNMEDAVLHGTLGPGEKNPNSKLTLVDVQAIRRLLLEGRSHSKISAMFGVSKTLITHINTGRRWSTESE